MGGGREKPVRRSHEQKDQLQLCSLLQLGSLLQLCSLLQTLFSSCVWHTCLLMTEHYATNIIAIAPSILLLMVKYRGKYRASLNHFTRFDFKYLPIFTGEDHVVTVTAHQRDRAPLTNTSKTTPSTGSYLVPGTHIMKTLTILLAWELGKVPQPLLPSPTSLTCTSPTTQFPRLPLPTSPNSFTPPTLPQFPRLPLPPSPNSLVYPSHPPPIPLSNLHVFLQFPPTVPLPTPPVLPQFPSLPSHPPPVPLPISPRH